MSCLQCNHIYGHAEGCPQYRSDQESEIESLRERVSQLETQLSEVLDRVRALEERNEEAAAADYWRRSQG